MTILGTSARGWETCRLKGSDITTNSPDVVVPIMPS